MYKNEDILNPPGYKPTSDEIKLAKARFVFENELWEIVSNLIHYYQMTKGKDITFPYSKEGIEKDALRSIEDWEKAMDEWDAGGHDSESWDGFIGEDWFSRVMVDGLSEMHAGDCTAFPCSCQRCLSETYFKIPSSISWKGKGEGYKLQIEYVKDVKEKKGS